MKKIFSLLVLFQILYLKENAQSGCGSNSSDSTPANCCWDLRSYLFDSIHTLDDDNSGTIYYGNGNSTINDIHYYDPSFADDDNCGQANNCFDYTAQDDALKIFVQYPNHHNYNATGGKLPAFIFFHGGGFSDCSSISDDKDVCTEMAHRGFVVFVCEYRRGLSQDGDFTSVFQAAAIYRAAQDIRGAIRYIIYRQNHHNDMFSSDPYQIDNDRIFLGGNSAGALTILTAAYYNDQMLYDIFSTNGHPSVDEVMGPADIDFYSGNDNLDYTDNVLGVLADWGALYTPHSAHDDPWNEFFSNVANPVPVIAFVGLNDDVFDPQHEWKKFSPNEGQHIFFNHTSSCVDGTYTVDTNANTNHDLYQMGSVDYCNMLEDNGVPIELYIDCEATHGLTKDCDNLPCFVSNFGTAADSQNEVYQYIASRAATFFQSIMNNDLGNRSKTHFRECENYRHACGSDSYASCASNPCN